MASHPVQNPPPTAQQSDPLAAVKGENDPLAELNESKPSHGHSVSLSLDLPQTEPSSGAHRRRESLASISRENDNARGRTEKRKRSRVTPEQLVELEKEFAVNRAPTAPQRKAISERLGMQERQTQIWFQNRRAKAKHQEGRPPSPNRHGPDGQPPLQLEAYIAQLIRETEPVTLIPCSDLKIGHWTRMNPSIHHYEVLAYTSPTRQCISWFIRSSGLSFKIEVPFTTIKAAGLVYDKGPALVTLVLELSAVPLFFVQQPDVKMRPGETVDDVRRRIGIAPHLPLPNIGADPGKWVASNDWTQNQQATRVLRHELTGPRTSVIPGVRAFPPELGLFPNPSEDRPPSPNQDLGLEPGLYHIFGPGSLSSAESPGPFWDGPYSAHTPSSASGYSSHTGSQVSAPSTSSWASGSEASSTRATPALELGEDQLVHPVPIHAPIPFMSNDSQRPQPLTVPLHSTDPYGAGLSTQGLPIFSGFDPQQQPVSGSISFSSYPDNNVAGLPLPSGNNDILTSNVRVSRYIQHQRRFEDANLGPQLGMQQPFPEFNLGTDFQDFDSYVTTDPLANTGGAINLGFEVDTSLSTLTTGPAVGTYPQNHTSNASFDDPSLYLQQPSQHNFNGLSYSGNQFASGTANMAQLQSQGPNAPQNQAGGAPQSQPNSRPGSLYGYQQFAHLQGQ